MVFVRFFGGINQIGGNKFLFENIDGDGKLMMDFGIGNEMGDYYAGYQKPNAKNVLLHLRELGIIPWKDHLNPELAYQYHPILRDYSFPNLKIPEKHKENYDYYYTHSHPDHVGLMGLLNCEATNYMSKGTYDYLRIWENLGQSTLFNRTTFFRQQSRWETLTGEDGKAVYLGFFGEKYNLKRGGVVKKKVKAKKVNGRFVAQNPNDPQPIERRRIDKQDLTDYYEQSRKIVKKKIDKKGRGIKFGDGLKVETFGVDHVRGASGALISAKDAHVVVTGDMRDTGLHPELTENFIEQAANFKPDALIIEGTEYDRFHHGNEYSLIREMIDLINSEEHKNGPVVMDFSYAHTDRQEVAVKVAKETDRELLLSPMKYSFMEQLQRRMFTREDERGVLIDKVGVYNVDKMAYENWEEKILGSKKLRQDEEIVRNPEEYILDLNLSRVGKLLDLKRYGTRFERGLAIISRTEPWDKYSEDRAKTYLRRIELENFEHHRLHVPSHLDQRGWIEAVRRIKPKNLIVVHTENPGLAEELVGNITNVVQVEPNRLYNISDTIELVV